MKNIILLGILFLVFSSSTNGKSWVRINQMGYLPQSVKVAVFISEESLKFNDFELVESGSDKVVFNGIAVQYDGAKWGMKAAARLNFSNFSTEGKYYILAGGVHSAVFMIDPDVYKGTADYTLQYMRQQRCGYNPYLKDSCHTHDGFIVDHPT